MTRSRLHRQHHTAPTGHARGKTRTLRSLASGVALVTVLLAGASLVTANNLATAGRTSQSLEQEISSLQAENSRLAEENSKLTSISHIYNAALTLGFVSPREVQGIKTPPVAFKDH